MVAINELFSAISAKSNDGWCNTKVMDHYNFVSDLIVLRCLDKKCVFLRDINILREYIKGLNDYENVDEMIDNICDIKDALSSSDTCTDMPDAFIPAHVYIYKGIPRKSPEQTEQLHPHMWNVMPEKQNMQTRITNAINKVWA
jgi:hypothetical protein